MIESLTEERKDAIHHDNQVVFAGRTDAAGRDIDHVAGTDGLWEV